MIRRANLNEIFAQSHATLTERLLDRLNAAIISCGGAIWRAFVDGLVAYAFVFRRDGPPPLSTSCAQSAKTRPISTVFSATARGAVASRTLSRACREKRRSGYTW
jgi:hypothetical protein